MADVHRTKRLRTVQPGTSHNRTTVSTQPDALPKSMTELGNSIIVYQKCLRGNDRKINQAIQQFTVSERLQNQTGTHSSSGKQQMNFKTAMEKACNDYEEHVEARRQLLEGKQHWLEEVCKIPIFDGCDQLETALDVHLEACSDLDKRCGSRKLRERFEELMRGDGISQSRSK